MTGRICKFEERPIHTATQEVGWCGRDSHFSGDLARASQQRYQFYDSSCVNQKAFPEVLLCPAAFSATCCLHSLISQMLSHIQEEHKYSYHQYFIIQVSGTQK